MKINRKHVEVLGFNPISDEYKCLGIRKITPDMAAYILEKLNKDNRPISKAQLNNLEKNIKKANKLFLKFIFMRYLQIY